MNGPAKKPAPADLPPAPPAMWACFICGAAGACPHREADLVLWMMRRGPGRETRGATGATVARAKEAGA